MKMNIFTRIIYIILAITICANAGAETVGTARAEADAGGDMPEADGDEKGIERIENGKKKAIKGFSGGMMVHTGYLFGYDNPYKYNTEGATFGLGGVARIHLDKQFRVGFEGYFSSMALHKDIASGSHNKVFWVGALADRFWKFGKFYPYAGVSVGGGMETSFYIFNGDKTDWFPEPDAVFHKQPFFAVDPFIGVEYKVGKALRLMLKADWLLAINSEGLNQPQGPRLYFGCIFAH